MEIITSHNALDFDGLAGMVAASKLYPEAVPVFSGTLSRNVRKFMALYKDLLVVKMPRDIDPASVTRMVVVDTASASRLGHLKDVAQGPGIDFHVFDHHPPSPEDVTASHRVVEEVGACTTILVEEICARALPLSAFEATILALGIYEDTGSLLFSTTTPRDMYAAAFLLHRGANLNVVANFIEQPFSGDQRELLRLLLNSARRYHINNTDVVLATAELGPFIPGLDAVTYRLFELEDADVAFSIALMEGKINVVGRSRSANVKVNEILAPLGGRGHDRAASVVVKKKNIEEVFKIILDGLGEKAQPALVASSIMSTPVKTVPMSMSMEEAGRVMLRYGHTGMPVVEGEKMIGVISRRDVDKARTHDLGHAPVKGFMSAEVLAVTPETPVNEIQRLMVEHDIGRLPVVNEGGRLVGIVSRTDIIRTLHGEDYPEDHQVLFSPAAQMENCAALMEERLPEKILSILQTAGQVAEESRVIIYCVGGFVRDLFLQVPNFDLDLVVEGEGIEFAQRLGERLGGKVRIHDRFGTAVVVLPDGTKVDVATARTEYYEFPAALPRVERSSIREDLYRRDFTINTLAVCLNPDRYGELIDYFGGRKDLDEGIVRILYNFSFVEDPTRILRAIRFEQRYSFVIEPETLRFAREAIQRRMLGKVSPKRILSEMILILNEKDPGKSLDRMKEIGVWNYVLPEVRLEDLNRMTLRRIPIMATWYQERYTADDLRTWLLYLAVLLERLDDDQVMAVLKRYPFDTLALRCLRESRQVPGVAAEIVNRGDLTAPQLDQILDNWCDENLVYLLLLVRDESIWDSVVHYLDLKGSVKVEIDGHDLKILGLQPGPAYRAIFAELYRLKLAEQVKGREEELRLAGNWIKEGRFA